MLQTTLKKLREDALLEAFNAFKELNPKIALELTDKHTNDLSVVGDEYIQMLKKSTFNIKKDNIIDIPVFYVDFKDHSSAIDNVECYLLKNGTKIGKELPYEFYKKQEEKITLQEKNIIETYISTNPVKSEFEADFKI